MANKAKDKRDECEIIFISAVEELGIVLGTAPINKRIVKIKFQYVESSFGDLQRAHAQFCQKAKISLSSAESSEYIRTQVKLKVKSLSEARLALGSEDDDSELSQLLNKLKSDQFKLKVDVEGKLASLESMTLTTLMTQDQHSSIMNMLEECGDNLNQYMDISGQIEKNSGNSDNKNTEQTFFKKK